MQTQTAKLTNLQLELLKVYSFNSTEKELLEIKTILGKYYAQRLTRMVDKVVDEKKLSQKDIDKPPR